MKIYLANNRYFEKQADARAESRDFRTIEFPFAATPKADFVDWLNEKGLHPADHKEPHLFGENDKRWRVYGKGNFAFAVVAPDKTAAMARAMEHLEIIQDNSF